ncbi:unnamed protein product [Paramecium primaurelia]|uniref:Uncharacterized protein n=1 Tax=Paramecium primaurelia TaxID=5886 RepID=A0A8S1NHN7_PARPR|nr:unnamed protein product [Paramecium primaurelia]
MIEKERIVIKRGKIGNIHHQVYQDHHLQFQFLFHNQNYHQVLKKCLDIDPKIMIIRHYYWRIYQKIQQNNNKIVNLMKQLWKLIQFLMKKYLSQMHLDKHIQNIVLLIMQEGFNIFKRQNINRRTYSQCKMILVVDRVIIRKDMNQKYVEAAENVYRYVTKNEVRLHGYQLIIQYSRNNRASRYEDHSKPFGYQPNNQFVMQPQGSIQPQIPTSIYTQLFSQVNTQQQPQQPQDITQ